MGNHDYYEKMDLDYIILIFIINNDNNTINFVTLSTDLVIPDPKAINRRFIDKYTNSLKSGLYQETANTISYQILKNDEIYKLIETYNMLFFLYHFTVSISLPFPFISISSWV